MKHTKKFLVFILITMTLVVWVGLVKGQKKIDLVLKQLIPFDDVRNESSFAVGEEIAIVNGKLFSLNEHGKMAMTKELPEPSKKPNGWESDYAPGIEVQASARQKYFGIIKTYGGEVTPDGVNQLILVDAFGNILFSTNLEYNGSEWLLRVSEQGNIAVWWTVEALTLGRFDLYNIKGELIKKDVKVTEDRVVPFVPWNGFFSDDGNYFVAYWMPSLGRVVNGTQKSLLILYNSKGDEIWRIEVPEACFGWGQVVMSPNNQYILADRLEFNKKAIVGDINFIEARYVDMYDNNGNRLWSHKVVIGGDLAIKFSQDSRYVVVATTENWIYTLESATGKEIWTYDAKEVDPMRAFLNVDISTNDKIIISARKNEFGNNELCRLYSDENDKTPWYFYIFDKDGQLLLHKDYVGQMVKSVNFMKDDKHIRIKFVRSVGYFEIVE